MASPGTDIDVALQELEARLERLRALYEQYFIGIEKIEPSVPRQDVDRRIYALRKVQIRNTAKRFKLQNIIQRYNAFQQYWLRICREIENGTYHRHVARAQSRFGEVPLTAAARRKARLQAASPEQQAAAEQKARATRAAEDDLDSLLNEDPEAALQSALEAADQVTAPPAFTVQAPGEAATADVPGDIEVVPVAGPGNVPAAAGLPAATGSAVNSDISPPALPQGATPPLPVRSAEGALPPPKAVPPPKPITQKRRVAAPDASVPVDTQLMEKPSAAPSPSATAASRRAEKTAAAAGQPQAPAAAAPTRAEKAAAAAGQPQTPAAAPTRTEKAAAPAQAPVAAPNATAATAGGPSAQARRMAAQKPGVRPAKGGEQRANSWAALRVPAAVERAVKVTVAGSGAEPAGAQPPPPQAPPQRVAPTGTGTGEKPVAAPTATTAARSPVAEAGAAAAARARAKLEAPAPAARVSPAKSEAPAPAPAARATAPSRSRLDDERVSQLHGVLVAERRRLQQPGKVSVDALASSLRDTELKLRQQYADKDIDFHVVVKNGKAVVKPIIG